jgi:hypothetical protein
MEAKTKEITPYQYARWYGCSPQYIHRLLLEENWQKLPKILEIKRYSRFYLLVVPIDLPV